jgi:hypothetical protein
VNDADLGTVLTIPAASAVPAMLTWLPDCTVLVWQPHEDMSDTIGTVLRYRLDGTLAHTYTFDSTLYETSEGPYGLQASLALNRLWFYGEVNETAPDAPPQDTLIIQTLDLTTSSVLATSYIPPPVEHDLSASMVCAAYETNPCTGAAIPVPQPYPPGATVATPIRRQRTTPHVASENRMVFYPGFQLLAQAGVVRDDDTAKQVITLEMSRDYGQTWSNVMTGSFDLVGQYLTRYRWQALGQGRAGMTFRVTEDTACRSVWLDAFLDPDPYAGTS